MQWVLVAVAMLVVLVIGFVAIGREAGMQATRARSAVFDLEEAVAIIADSLPEDVAGRLTHDDVRWILRADVDRFEEATLDADDASAATDIVDQDATVAAILAQADASGRNLSDGDVVAVLDGRLAYLQAIGAIGPEVR